MPHPPLGMVQVTGGMARLNPKGKQPPMISRAGSASLNCWRKWAPGALRPSTALVIRNWAELWLSRFHTVGDSPQSRTANDLREGRNVARLNHRGIVSIYDVGFEDGSTFIVSEFVNGTTLAELVAQRPLSSVEASEIILQIADALDHAHRQRLIHRDLKPTNVLLQTIGDSAHVPMSPPANEAIKDAEVARAQRQKRSPSRTIDLPYLVRLTDFGLARTIGGDSSLTLDGQLLGTPAYMSPEQAGGRSDAVDPRSDIFSLGVLFYELLTGARPFVGTGHALLQRIQYDDPVAPTAMFAQVPRDLEIICLKCLRKSPGDRYQSAAEVAEDLRRWQRHETIYARGRRLFGSGQQATPAEIRRGPPWPLPLCSPVLPDCWGFKLTIKCCGRKSSERIASVRKQLLAPRKPDDNNMLQT